MIREPWRHHHGTRRDPVALEAWTRGYTGFKTHPVVRLTAHGPDWGTMPGPGDEVGYGMDPYRTDDCLQAAIATCLQVGIEEVPDPDIDNQLRAGKDPDEIGEAVWSRIAAWAGTRGLALRYWEDVPVARERWIGIVAERDPDAPPFNDHCIVMDHNRIVFEPMCSVIPPPGTRMVDHDPADISSGLSFDSFDKEE